MAIPKGPIVERPMLPRSCGCLGEFQVYQVDRYRKERQAKFQSTRCPACAEKLMAEQRKLAVPKGEAFSKLPPGTQMVLVALADGTWAGRLTGQGHVVESDAAGPQALTVNLARKWLVAAGLVE